MSSANLAHDHVEATGEHDNEGTTKGIKNGQGSEGRLTLVPEVNLLEGELEVRTKLVRRSSWSRIMPCQVRPVQSSQIRSGQEEEGRNGPSFDQPSCTLHCPPYDEEWQGQPWPGGHSE